MGVSPPSLRPATVANMPASAPVPTTAASDDRSELRAQVAALMPPLTACIVRGRLAALLAALHLGVVARGGMACVFTATSSALVPATADRGAHLRRNSSRKTGDPGSEGGHQLWLVHCSRPSAVHPRYRHDPVVPD